MPDRRKDHQTEVALEYAVFLTATRGMAQAFSYLDGERIAHRLLWRVLQHGRKRWVAERRRQPRS